MHMCMCTAVRGAATATATAAAARRRCGPACTLYPAPSGEATVWTSLHPVPCTLKRGDGVDQPAPCTLYPAPSGEATVWASLYPVPCTLHPQARRRCGPACTLHPHAGRAAPRPGRIRIRMHACAYAPACAGAACTLHPHAGRDAPRPGHANGPCVALAASAHRALCAPGKPGFVRLRQAACTRVSLQVTWR